MGEHMNIPLLLIIGISLSLDAFSLSLSYGLMNIEESKIRLTSIVVGIFHFFMPLLGLMLSNIIIDYINFDLKYFVIIIFLIIIIGVLKSIREKEKIYYLNIYGVLLFSLGVSIDSFNIGLSLPYLTNTYIIASIIFMSLSGLITYIGFKLGKYISIKVGNLSKYLSALLLFLVSLYIFFS